MGSLYHWYKEHGICVICGRQDADVGLTTCLACRMNVRSRGETHKTESLYRHRQWLKRRRDLLYTFRVCINCGKRDAAEGKSVCEICATRGKLRAEKRRREKGILPRNSYTKNGICYFCNEPVLEGKKVCEKHYKVCCENLVKARSTPREENYFEKQNKLFWTEKKQWN